MDNGIMAKSKRVYSSVRIVQQVGGLKFLEELKHPQWGRIIVQFRIPLDGVEKIAVSREPTDEEKVVKGGVLWKLEYLTRDECLQLR